MMMMLNAHAASNKYAATQVNTSKPIDLVIMLYDGAVENLKKAINCMESRDVAEKGEYISKSTAIIDELNASLNLEAGGEIALNLQGLYLYMNTTITNANIRNDVNKLNHVIDLLEDIRSAWVQIR